MKKQYRKPVVVHAQLSPSSAINVTPLVDVVLVLLIIFMVLSPLLERNLDVRVPSPTSVQTSDLPPDQLVVHLEPGGALRVNGEPVPQASYVQVLTERLQRQAPDQRVVFFSAADDADYALLVRAFDDARRAGARSVAMSTDPPTPADVVPALR